MTVSSFNTVTLTPSPVVSFNVKRPSETLSALLKTRRFLAHLLSPNKDAAALARDFSRGNQCLAGFGEGSGVFGFEFVEAEGSAEGEGEGDGEALLPVLRRRKGRSGSQAQDSGDEGRDDFPFIFECQLHDQQVEVHDHTVVFGTVVRTLVGGSPGTLDGRPGQASDLCLTYADTRFWEMGREI
ncbi:oxidoreductase [Aspergillus sp. HF37]|nr:oxidoreductase [Aspergillus sp. HF37]